MSGIDLSLLSGRRFAPLFAVQFLGAFNDNLLKFAILFMAAFGASALAPADAVLLATASSALFVLPYFLFGGVAGQLADAVDKAQLVRVVKSAEVAITLLALAGFHLASYPILLTALFLMGCHSTVFGPVKYAILPQHLRADQIMAGTGMIEAGTFVAILGGQLAAGLMRPWEAGLLAVGLSAVGLAASLLVPAAGPMAPDMRIDRNPLRATRDVLRAARRGRGAWLSILGISWFFAVGAVLLSEFGALASGTLRAGPEVVTAFLLIFSLGVASGSLLVGRLLGGVVSARYVPAAALGMAFSMIGIWLAARGWTVPVASASDLFGSARGLLLMACLLGTAVSGGVFVVPLYALLQTASADGERARTISANNVVNAAVTVAVVAVVSIMLARGESVPGVIGALGFATLAVALISCWLLPETVFKALVRAVLRLAYRVEVAGGENMPVDGAPAVVVVNHVSFLDGLLLAAFLPGKPTFAVATRIARSIWIRPFLGLFDAFPVDPTNPMAVKAMVRAVRDERRTLVIFPEGRITVTGALMKVFDGPGMVAAKAGAPIVPVRIDGAQYTPFSRLRGKVRLRWFPRIRLTVLPPRVFALEEASSARDRRKAAGRKLYDEMSAMVFATAGSDVTLFGALVAAAGIYGRKAVVLEDVKREPMSYGRLLTASLVLGRKFAAMTRDNETVGLLLPNVSAAAVSFFGLQAFGRVPAMLNYTAGSAALGSACGTACIRTVITSRAFVAQAGLLAVIEALEAGGDGRDPVQLVFLEDVAPTVSRTDKAVGLLRSMAAARFHSRFQVDTTAPAVILFTSGSEGLPKAVVLSHRNLLANLRQLGSRIDFNASDVVLNALPVFHSFGLTGGMLLPMLNGIRTVLYPSPLHYRIVPAFAYDANATILFGTDTFLAGYARMANPYDFYSVRYVFAGAERVRPETRKSFSDRFGLRILEGYGTTETSPVIAVNTPMHFRDGTVGRILPGMEARLDPVPGIEGGGRLFVRGPNVMSGYMLPNAPGVLVPPESGWHDTGDVVEIDGEGFVRIMGRAKRFAKIGGEMVSLPAVEGNAAQVWPGFFHAAVTRPDARKGEQIVLFTTVPDARAADFAAWARTAGVAELAMPRDVRTVAVLPVLGTGKTDYVTLAAMAAGPAAP